MSSLPIKQKKRQPHQVKKAKKGLKSMRGQGEYYDQPKNRVCLSLTQTATGGLDKISQDLNLSRSELVEKIGRREYKLVPVEPLAFA